VLPDPPLLHLLLPKWLTARARSMQGEKGRGARFAILGLTGFLFWAFIFGVLFRLLTYFRGVQEIGQLLAGKLLGLILLGFTSILLLSNVITALSSFFLAKDLDMLVAGPVDWLKLYGAKLLETVIASSWMVLLVSVPMFSAYGLVYDGGWFFPLLVAALMLPMFIIPAVVGSAVTLTLVNVFPARRTRDILSVIAVLTAGGIVLLFRLIRPEQLARPEGFRNLVDFIAVLRTPTSPLLPSEWVQKATMGYLNGEPDWLAMYLLWTTAAAAVVLGALLHRWLYLTGFSKAQESAQRFVKSGGALLALGQTGCWRRSGRCAANWC
jgi:ABC-2 type transport system permease protein